MKKKDYAEKNLDIVSASKIWKQRCKENTKINNVRTRRIPQKIRL